MEKWIAQEKKKMVALAPLFTTIHQPQSEIGPQFFFLQNTSSSHHLTNGYILGGPLLEVDDSVVFTP